MAQILDGNRVRDEIKAECRPRIERLIARGRPPGLTVVLVGHNPASEIYVRSKVKTSEELGIRGRETFRSSGGKDFALLDCLNDSAESMTMLERLITRELAGWLPQS